MNSSPSKRRPRWKKVSSVPPISSSTPFRVHKGANGSPMPPPCRRPKNTLELIERVPQQCHSRATRLTSQAHNLHQELKKAMRCFGRQCRGQGHVFVKLVRHTEQKLLALGEPLTALGQQAQQLLAQRRRSATPTASVSPRRSPRRCAAMRTSASNPHGSSTGKSSTTVNSSMPTI